jgi:TonB family protein
MSSILVLEQEPGDLERIRHALGAEGWSVRTVHEPAQALQAAASEAPDLVIVNAAMAGAGALTGSFSRRAGGPGLVGLLSEQAAEAGFSGFPADELLAKPFSDEDLRTVVRRALAAGHGRPPAPAAPTIKLTSQDIFGDVLAAMEGAEMEGAGGGKLPAAPPARPAAPLPIPPRPAAAPAPSPSAAADEINRRLEETLSGVFGADLKRPQPAVPAPAAPSRPAAPAAAAAPPPRRPETVAPPRKPDLGSDEDLDAILSKTLSSLDMGRPRPAAPPAGPPAAAATPAPPRPAASGPRPISATAAAPEGTGVRKAPAPTPMDLGLAEIEELARTRRKPEAAPPGAPQAPPAPRPQPAAPPAAVPARPASPAATLPASPAPKPPAPAPPPPGIRTERIELPPPVRTAPAAPVPGIAPPRPAAPVSVAPAMSADSAATQRIPIVPADEAGSQPGEPFGQYNLLEKVAVGGMAEVWKARSRGVEGFQKLVAIKKILPHMSDNSEFIGMFIDEAKLAAQLSHPNIVHIYDLGKIGRSYYIAMEFVEGKDLRSILNAGRRRGLPLPMGLALLIAARLASALDYAHRKRDFEGRDLGLVHRDVSPQNVLISYEGDVKLCDFGIAKAVSKAGQTQMGALKGKLQYMSPEQAWGRAVDARSDIFSLGAVLFEMLTGERLFSGESEMSVLESVRQGRTRSPREVNAALPADVDEIVTRALAQPIQNRFQSAGEMSQRIEAVLHSLSPSPGPADLAVYIQRVVEPEDEAEAHSAHFLLEPASAAAPAAPAAPPAAAPAVAGSEAEDLEPVPAVAPLGEVRVEETGKRGRGLLYAAIAVLLLAIVLTFVFKMSRKGSPAAPVEPTPPPAAAPAAGAGAPTPVPAGPAASTAAPVDLNALVGQELKKKQEEIQKQQEAKVKELEKQIADAKKNGKPVPGQPPPTAPAAPGPEARSDARAAAPPPSAPAASTTAPEPAPSLAAQVPPSTPAPEPEPPKAQERPAPQQQAPAPEAPRVHTGDLVPGGPGVSPPELVSAPKPEYPPQARRLQVQGVVVVSVLVDETGRVQDARLTEPIPQKVGINEAALQVARNAQYRPATKDGVKVKMWTRLRIPFKL